MQKQKNNKKNKKIK